MPRPDAQSTGRRGESWELNLKPPPQNVIFSGTKRSDDKADGDKMSPLKSRVNYLVLCDGHRPLMQPFLFLRPERVKGQLRYSDTP